jgi:hypothetical protein
LIEGIDNANNLVPLNLWKPLVELLKHDEYHTCVNKSLSYLILCLRVVLYRCPHTPGRHTSDLWKPLVELLKHDEAEIRRMAAWCVGTAVQNNPQAQDQV